VWCSAVSPTIGLINSPSSSARLVEADSALRMVKLEGGAKLLMSRSFLAKLIMADAPGMYQVGGGRLCTEDDGLGRRCQAIDESPLFGGSGGWGAQLAGASFPADEGQCGACIHRGMAGERGSHYLQL